MAPELLAGWGGTPAAGGRVSEPHERGDVLTALANPSPRGVIARGLGRSYGDAAQRAGGDVIRTTGLDRVLEVDLDKGLVRAEAGVSLDTLMHLLVPRGYFVAVTPGTRQVTVGGAIASDVHGKNHHVDGSFCDHVRRVVLATPIGRFEIGAGPADDQELFWATAGGMGLTGVILEATLSLLPIETSSVLVDTERAVDLADLMDRMEGNDDSYRYSVAWVDCLSGAAGGGIWGTRRGGASGGGRLGRGVLTRANHAMLVDLGRAGARDALGFAGGQRLSVPKMVPSGLLNAATIRAFNEAWYRKSPRRRLGQPQSIPSFFHPLDGIADWNRLYGRRGFIQYQMVVPFGAEEVLESCVAKLARSGVPSFLGVLKRFGKANPAPLSFPIAGWTLALDFPIGNPALPALLSDLDEDVAGAGGRVYLSKDSRLRPELVEAMYPRLREWQKVKQRVDPGSVMRSDLGLRLGLVEPGPS